MGFEGPSRAHHALDWQLMDNIAALAALGYGTSILLGADTVIASARSTADGPGMPYLLTTVRPRIEHELGRDLATAIFVDNPASAFSAEWSQ